MEWRMRLMALVAGLVLAGLALPARAATTLNDTFDVRVSLIPADKPPVTNAFLYRGYTDANGASHGQLTPISDLTWGDSNAILIGLLLPAVQKVREAATVIGFCDGSVLVGMGDGSVTPIIGNADFDFPGTFGAAESDVISALQKGDTNAIIAVLDKAYNGGLLPAVQTQTPAQGTLVNFSTPTYAGTFAVAQVPEPATAGVLALAAGLLLRRRRPA